MSRSGYSEDGDGDVNLYRQAVDRAINGKRGQAFLRELAKTMDEMPERRLIAGDLIAETGEMCTIGVVCKARGIDVTKVDVYDPKEVGDLVGIAQSMAAEIEYENDDRDHRNETPEDRWIRMRRWVTNQLRDGAL